MGWCGAGQGQVEWAGAHGMSRALVHAINIIIDLVGIIIISLNAVVATCIYMYRKVDIKCCIKIRVMSVFCYRQAYIIIMNTIHGL